ncbi:unnamed protein product, partial [Musa textilis]
ALLSNLAVLLVLYTDSSVFVFLFRPSRVSEVVLSSLQVMLRSELIHCVRVGRRCYNLWVVIAECKNKCDFRCSATSHQKPCIFFCNKCCATCLCVPPGTHGNKEVCPCYNNWKTKEGGPKCP